MEGENFSAEVFPSFFFFLLKHQEKGTLKYWNLDIIWEACKRHVSFIKHVHIRKLPPLCSEITTPQREHSSLGRFVLLVHHKNKLQ